MTLLFEPPHRGTRVAPLWQPLLLAGVLWTLTLPALAQRALLSHAEQPAKLIRKTTVYDAPAGTTLQAGDILEAGPRGLQIEWPNGAMMALGPASSVRLNPVGDPAAGSPAAGSPAARSPAARSPTVSLLRGWIKLATSQPAVSQLSAIAGVLEVRTNNGSGILRLTSDKTELFVERGTLEVFDQTKGGSAAPALPVTREQYALRPRVLALQVAARPPRLFVAQMPREFFDPLVPVARRAPPAQPSALREVDAKDLGDWNDVAALLNKRLVAQFAARLADPAFARDATTLLASNPDWRLALQKQSGVKKRATITTYWY